MAGLLGDLLLALENSLGLPFPFIVVCLVFAVYAWTAFSLLKDQKETEDKAETILKEIAKQRDLLEQIAFSGGKKGARVEGRQPQSAVQGILLERESVDADDAPIPPFPGDSDPDIPRSYNGGVLVEIAYMDGVRTAKYAQRHPNYPDQILFETYRFPLHGKRKAT